jgi:transcriptional regulator with XRE-family HTH domain
MTASAFCAATAVLARVGGVDTDSPYQISCLALQYPSAYSAHVPADAVTTPEEEAELAERAAANEVLLLCLVGYNVRRIRTSRGDRQCDLLLGSPNVQSAQSARTNGNRIENGKLTMSTFRLGEIAALLGVSVRELLLYPKPAAEIAELRKLVEERLRDRDLRLDLLSW